MSTLNKENIFQLQPPRLGPFCAGLRFDYYSGKEEVVVGRAVQVFLDELASNAVVGQAGTEGLHHERLVLHARLEVVVGHPPVLVVVHLPYRHLCRT